MNEKISNKILAIPIAICFSIIALFCFFCIGLSRVEAQSYYFSNPSLHRICANTTINNSSTGCTTNNYSNWVSALNPGERGNYLQVAYRMNTNNNGVTGTTYEPGNYSVSFSGYIETIPEADISIDKIKLDLIYYPNSSNTYGKAVCDNDESFKVTKSEGSYGDSFVYSYSCETLTITENKSFIGYELYINNPGLVEYIQLSNIITNMSLIGAGDATNNDVINNQNQNTQDIINNATQNTDKVVDSIGDIENTISDETAPNLDSFNNMTGWLPPGPLDSVLNLPLNVLNGFVNVFNNGTCASVFLPLPFLDSNLEIPCIYSIYSKIDGLNIFLTSIFTAISGYLMFKYLCNLYVWIDDRLKMKESDYMSDWGGV